MPKPAEIISEDDIIVHDEQDDDSNQLEQSDDDDRYDEDEEDSGDSADDDGDDDEDQEDEKPQQQDSSVAEAKNLLFQTKLAQRELANERAQDRIAALRGRHGELVEKGKQYKLLEAQAISEANGNDALQYSGMAENLIAEANQIASIHDELLKRVEADTEEINEIKAAVSKPEPRKRMIDADALEQTITSNTQSFMSKINYETLPQKLRNAVDAMDKKLFAEGYNPASPKYWQLLEKRYNEKYRNRASNTDSNSQQDNSEENYVPKSSPPVSGKSNSAGSSKKDIYLSRERKEALIAAGVWDDPVLRTKYVKQYQKWDKENATR